MKQQQPREQGPQPQLQRPHGDVRYQELRSGVYWQIHVADSTTLRSRSLGDETLPMAPYPDPLTVDGPDDQQLIVLTRTLLMPGAQLDAASLLDLRPWLQAREGGIRHSRSGGGGSPGSPGCSASWATARCSRAASGLLPAPRSPRSWFPPN